MSVMLHHDEKTCWQTNQELSALTFDVNLTCQFVFSRTCLTMRMYLTCCCLQIIFYFPHSFFYP